MYDIRLKQIECFLDISQTLSFTESAKRLHISQPLASKWIRSIEDELSIQLFYRNKDGLVLTPEGQYLKDRWASPYAVISSAIVQAKEISDGENIRDIRIGFDDLYELDEMVEFMINTFSQRNPEFHVHLSPFDGMKMEECLIDGELDIAFAFWRDFSDKLNRLPLRDTDFYIAISRTHRLSRMQSITTKDLSHEVFFALNEDEDPKAVERIQSLCKKAGFSPRAIRMVPNASSLVQSIMFQNGVAIAPGEIMKEYGKQIRLIESSDITQTASIALFTRKDNPGRAAVFFSEFAAAFIREYEQ